jgi:peroxiredoxin
MRLRQSYSRSSSRSAHRSARTPATLLTALAAAAALALTGCSGSGAHTGSSNDNANYVAGTGLTTTVPVKDRKAAVDLSGKDLDGQALNLSSYKGKVVVLNVWGSWCPPCRAEAADFESVFKATQAEGVQFVGLDTRDPQITQAKLFVSSHGLTYPSFYDVSGELLLKFPDGTLNPQAIPTTLILDRQGRVAVRALTPLTAEQLTAIIKPVLAETA